MSSARNLSTRKSAAAPLAALGLVLLLGACSSEPPPGPTVLVLPGQNKDLTTFQQDDLICRQHAAAHTGFDGPVPSAQPAPANGTASDATSGQGGSALDNNNRAPAPEPADKTAYAQCMAARGDVVRVEPSGYPAVNPYGYPYLDPYPYWYGYPYAFDFPFFFYGGGFFHGFGWSHDGFYHGTWHERGFVGRGFGRGGFARGGGFRGGGHGAGGHH